MTVPIGPWVAIVDAYNDPNVESDLAVYRTQFGLPPCTTENGCFKKLNQSGLAAPLPATNSGWSSEIALDVEMVSAICPTCKILLVEANSASFTDLGTAVNTASSMQGVVAVSNSYGGRESPFSSFYASYYNHPGIAITASSGDSGYGVSVPAAYQSVVAVGGTTLTANPQGSPRPWTETVWSGAGSGCSSYVSKPKWQTDSGCNKRTVADVAAVADPYTGVAVYDTTGSGGWTVFGGTSVSSPIIAAMYALAGSVSSITCPVTGSPKYAACSTYVHRTSLNDIISGGNGSCSSRVLYLCTARVGFDGPTGNGTPNGIGGFLP